jgi:hypothetical protein
MKSFVSMFSSVLAGTLMALFIVSPTLADPKLPEVSPEGLHLLHNTKVKIAYVRPGVTLNKYTKVNILECYVDLAKNWQRDYNLNRVGLSGRVSDRFAEEIKRSLAEQFRDVFTKELTKAGRQVVTGTGPDVLLLRPALIHVRVTAPDVARPGISSSYVRSAGGMTLFMEMYDSDSDTLLARVIDPRADPEGVMRQATNVSNKAAAKRILRRWADLLVRALGDVDRSTGQ